MCNQIHVETIRLYVYLIFTKNNENKEKVQNQKVK